MFLLLLLLFDYSPAVVRRTRKVHITMAAIPLLVSTSGLLVLTDETPSLKGPWISSMMVPITLVDLASGHGTLSSCDRARPTATIETGRDGRDISVVVELVSSTTAGEVFDCWTEESRSKWWTIVLLSVTIVVSSSSTMASVVDDGPAASSAKYSSLPFVLEWAVDSFNKLNAVDVDTMTVVFVSSGWIVSSKGSDGSWMEVDDTMVSVVVDVAKLDCVTGIGDDDMAVSCVDKWVDCVDTVSGVLGKTDEEDIAACWRLSLVPRISAARSVSFPLPVRVATADAARSEAPPSSACTVAGFASFSSSGADSVTGTTKSSLPFHGSIATSADGGHSLGTEQTTTTNCNPSNNESATGKKLNK